MKILITGKHVDIGDSLKQHIKESSDHNIVKFFEDAVSVHVTLGKNNSSFTTDIIVNEGTGNGVIIKSSGENHDAYRSFDIAISKLSKRLQKYKKKNYRI